MGMWMSSASRVVKHLGLEPKEDLDEICIHKSMDDAIRYIIEEYNLSIPFEELKLLPYKLTEEMYFNELQLKSHTKALLEQLKSLGYKMIVATATPAYLVEACFKRLGIIEYFIDILSVKDYNTTKKEPKIFEIALDKLGLDKKEVIVFEDDANPISTCLAANFNVVGVRDIAQGEKFKSIIPKLVDVISLD